MDAATVRVLFAFADLPLPDEDVAPLAAVLEQQARMAEQLRDLDLDVTDVDDGFDPQWPTP